MHATASRSREFGVCRRSVRPELLTRDACYIHLAGRKWKEGEEKEETEERTGKERRGEEGESRE